MNAATALGAWVLHECRDRTGGVGALCDFPGGVGATCQQEKLHSAPTPPVGSQHSCQPTVKLHILPHSMDFSSGNGVVRQQLGFTVQVPILLAHLRKGRKEAAKGCGGRVLDAHTLAMAM